MSYTGSWEPLVNLYSSYSGLEINGATNFNVRYILIIFTLQGKDSLFMATTCSESSINYECLLILLLFLESMWSFLAKANIYGFFLCVAIKNLDLFTYCSWHASFCDFRDLS